MYCWNCGHKNSAEAKFCRNCGVTLKDEGRAEEPKNPEDSSEDSSIEGTLTPKQIKFINSAAWGPTLGFVYVAWMRSWWLVGLWLGAVVLDAESTFGIFTFALTIYLVFKGRGFAWRTREWKSFKEFKEVQEKWDVWGKWVLIASAIIVLGGIAFSALE